MEVLRDMSMRPNIIPILGNHEYAAHEILRQLSQVYIKDGSIKKKPGSDINIETFAFEVQTWLDIGGGPTLQGFMRLPEDEKEFMLEYLEEFSLYEMIKVNGTKYLLTHIGLPKGATDTNLNRFDAYDFIADPDTYTDYTKQYFDDIVLVTGHLPTLHIGEEYRGRIYHANNHLAIDTGGVFGEKFACVCLDTGEEFYVPAKNEEIKIYTVFMNNDIKGEGAFKPQRYGTLEQVWECEVIRPRRSVTFDNFAELIEEHGAVRMHAATVYKGEIPPAMCWFVNIKKLVPMPVLYNE
jgi:serine/threonine protein phosphatase 1